MSDRCAHCGTDGVHHCYAAEVKRLESRAAELEAALRALVEAVSRANEYPCLPCSRRGHSHPEPIDSAPLRAALLLLANGG